MTSQQQSRIPAQLKWIYDGDTIDVKINGKGTTIRLHGIDAPEMGQAYGQNSKNCLWSLIKDKKKFTIQPTNQEDKYGRLVAKLFIGNMDVNLAMIEKGYAWHYKRYDNDANYSKAHQEAKQAKRGLWQGKNPIHPAIWRKLNAEKQDKEVHHGKTAHGKTAHSQKNGSGYIFWLLAFLLLLIFLANNQ